MQLNKKFAAIGTGLAVMANNALAAVPVEVTTAITDATTDGKTIGYALLGFAVAVGVIFYLKRRAG